MAIGKKAGKEDGRANQNNQENKKKLSILDALAVIPQVSLSIAIPIVLGAAAGHWLDQKLGTGIIFFLILLFLGIAGGFYSAYNQLVAPGKRKK
jgi:ATP synthase protein I